MEIIELTQKLEIALLEILSNDCAFSTKIKIMDADINYQQTSLIKCVSNSIDNEKVLINKFIDAITLLRLSNELKISYQIEISFEKEFDCTLVDFFISLN